MVRPFFISFLLLLSFSCAGAADAALQATGLDTGVRYSLDLPKGGLARLMRWSENRIPLVSAHRGGPMPGYPENAIETLDHSLRFGPAILEVDVAQLADGTLILLHDDTLDRTTTGRGAIENTRWTEVSKLFLKDPEGTVTRFHVPTLAEALRWAKGRAVLNLDIKRSTNPRLVTALIDAAGAHDHAMLITYTLDQATAYHRLAPDLMLNVTIRSLADLERVQESGIDPARIIAWTGLRVRDKALYDAIHAKGWRVSIGTLGFDNRSLDTQILRSGDDSRYKAIYAQGVDMISTDRPWAVQAHIFNPNLVFFQSRPAFIRKER